MNATPSLQRGVVLPRCFCCFDGAGHFTVTTRGRLLLRLRLLLRQLLKQLLRWLLRQLQLQRL